MKVRFWFQHGYNEEETDVIDFPEGTSNKVIQQEYENWFYDQCST